MPANRHSVRWTIALLATATAVHADTASLTVAEFGLAPIDILSTTFSAAQPPQPHHLGVTVPAGTASVDLAGALSSGRVLAAPTLTFTRNPPEPYHHITLYGATVTAITSSLPASPPGALARDTATLEFDRYERTHTLAPGIADSVFFNCPDLIFTRTTDGNAPPTIATIPPQTVPAGASFDIALVLDDPDSPLPTLTLSSVHPNTPLLPPGSITFAPPAPSTLATVTLPPAISGSILITLVADDSSNRGHASFLLTVTPNNNNAPTAITLSSDTLAETTPDGQTIATITVADPDLGDSHTLTLDDDDGGRFAIAGTDLIVADTSSLDFETTDTHHIAITAVDSTGNAYSQSFILHLTDVPEGAFDTFRADHFNPAQLADPQISGLLADPDLDGHNNLTEHNGNSDPLDPASVPPPLQIADVQFNNQTHTTLTWRQITSAADPQMEVYPQFSTDTLNWTEGTLAFTTASTTPDGPNHERITARLNTPKSAHKKELLRLRLRRVDP